GRPEQGLSFLIYRVGNRAEHPLSDEGGQVSFVTRKHIPRRTFLRGAGVTLSLPLLESMVPALTALAQTAANPRLRMGFCFMPHGAVMANWTAATEGPLQLPPILAALQADRDQLM